MTDPTPAQWEALAVAFADGGDAVPDDSWSVDDVIAASVKSNRPIRRTTASLRVRAALRHGLIVCVRDHAGTRPARYVFADGVRPDDVAAALENVA